MPPHKFDAARAQRTQSSVRAVSRGESSRLCAGHQVFGDFSAGRILQPADECHLVNVDAETGINTKQYVSHTLAATVVRHQPFHQLKASAPYSFFQRACTSERDEALLGFEADEGHAPPLDDRAAKGHCAANFHRRAIELPVALAGVHIACIKKSSPVIAG